MSSTNQRADSVSGDYQVLPTPSDSASCIKFAPSQDRFAITAWDSSAMVFSYSKDGAHLQSQLVSKMTQNPHTLPVLCCAWSPDNAKLATGAVDKTAKVWDISTGVTERFATHDQPIKSLHWIPSRSMVVTGSWDKTLKYWPTATMGDCKAAASVTLSERIYAMDVKDETAVVACADRVIHTFDLRSPTVPIKTHQSPLRHQIRTVALFHDLKGYAIGSIEGRVHIHHYAEADAKSNFAFKCHRDPNNQDIYAVNQIVFHPTWGTFCTVGSDGTFNFWDKEAKQRLRGFPRLQNSISSADFSYDGDVFGYTVAYDWSRGYEPRSGEGESTWLHVVQESELRPRQRRSSQGPPQ